MKLFPLPTLQLLVLLGTALALPGCKAAPTAITEGAPPVQVVTTSVEKPDLVTVTNLAPEAPTNAPEQAAVGEIKLSDRLQEIIKMAQSGVGDEVILAYIRNSPEPFNPSSEEILYLTDIGLSDVVITALVNHRAAPAEVAQRPADAPAGVPQTSPEQGTPVPAPAPAYNPEPQVVYTQPPVVQYTTPAPLVQYSYFYSSLSPYGSWVDVADYGWCWQPTVAVIHHGWRPYSDRGRWIYSDYGWYWQSDYSWGWAPFHYGRWFNHPARGWCWSPDSVWGPAWVSWRHHHNYYGWAPLPPGAHYRSGVGFTYYGAHVGVSFGFGLRSDCWNFVPRHRFYDRDVWRHRVHSADTLAIYKNSTVVNNYIVGNNNTIINEGIGRDRVASATRSEIRKVAVRDLPNDGRNTVRPDRLHREGSELVVYRPKPSFAALDNRNGVQADNARIIAARTPTRAGELSGSRDNARNSLPGAASTPSARGGSEVVPSAGPARHEPAKRDPSASDSTPSRNAQVGKAGEGSRGAPATLQPSTATTQRREPPRPVIGLPGAAESRRNAATSPANPGSGSLSSIDALRSAGNAPAKPAGDLSGRSLPNRPAPSVLAAPQPAARETANGVASPGVRSRGEPSRSFSSLNPSVASTAPSTPLVAPRPNSATRQELPKASVIAPERPTGQSSSAPLTFRVPTSPGTPTRTEPSHSWSSLNPSSSSVMPNTPQAVPQPSQATRRELPKVTVIAPERTSPRSSSIAPQTFSVPSAASGRSGMEVRGSASSSSSSFQHVAPSAPQAVSPPVQAYRRELPRPTPSLPQRSSVPTPSYAPPRSDPVVRYSAPAPRQSFSLPSQPSYTPPQASRPAPSFSLPSRPAPSAPAMAAPSRSAPQSAPAPSSAGRSSNRRQY